MFKTLQITLLLLCFIFTQNIQAQYCSANGGSTDDEWIQSITIGNFNYNSGNDNGYENLTSQTINLRLGGGTRKAQIFNFIPNAKIVKEPKIYQHKPNLFILKTPIQI